MRNKTYTCWGCNTVKDRSEYSDDSSTCLLCQARWEPIVRLCEVCNKETTNPSFCSVDCYTTWQAKQPNQLRSLLDSGTQLAGFNKGLDREIKDNGELRKVMKEQGLAFAEDRKGQKYRYKKK